MRDRMRMLAACCLVLLAGCGAGPADDVESGAGEGAVIAAGAPALREEGEAPVQNRSTSAAADWREYFGSHGSDGESFVRSLRGVGRGTLGPRTFAAEAPGSALADSIEAMPSDHDLVVNIGGLGSGRQRGVVGEFLAMIRADGGRSWTANVRDAALRASAARPRERIIWQIGNEINSDAMSARALEDSRRGGEARANDPAVIPFYVEAGFAPTVLGLRQASERLYGSPDAIRIALGSVTQTSTPEGRAWLRSLLAYRIEGEYAPELAGRTVAELIEIVTVHYLVTVEQPRWRTGLEDLFSLVGQGRIRGVWSTEEIGRRRGEGGLGGATALRVAARYLDWWLLRGIDPQAGRCFFWGGWLGPEGGRGADAMERVASFLGATALERIEGAEVRGEGDPEAYAFRALRSGDVLVVVSASMRAAQLREIRVPSSIGDAARVEAVAYTAEGARPVAVTFAAGDGNPVVRFTEPASLPRGAALALFITRSGSGE